MTVTTVPIVPASEVRAWARANGWQVGVRGLLPGYVWTAYFAAHPVTSTIGVDAPTDPQ